MTFRERYEMRRASRLCVDCAAGLQDDDVRLCVECAERRRAAARRYARTARGKATHLRYVKAKYHANPEAAREVMRVTYEDHKVEVLGAGER